MQPGVTISAFLAAPVTARAVGGLGVIAPPAAAAMVLVGGWLTPGYDPFVRTISRLAEPGLPAAFGVEPAICLVACALLGLAVVLGRLSGVGRALLALSGGALLIATAIRLDPSSAGATAGHRVATIIAIVGLAGAPLAFGSSLKHRRAWGAYGRISFAFGAAEVGMLLVGLGLLTTTFADWGAWERGFLALPMVWMVLMSGRLLRARTTEPRSSSTAENSSWASNVSADETMKAAAASQSSGGA